MRFLTMMEGCFFMSQNNRSKPTRVAVAEPGQPTGKNLYFDNKKRMIYVSPYLHEALYLPKYEYKKFNRFQSRYVICAATFMILGPALSSWFELPLWIAFVIALLALAGFEYSFYRFQKGLTVVKNFDKESAISTVDQMITSESRQKAYIKIVLYILLGVLLVFNAYDQHYSQVVITICWIALVGCLYMAFTLIRMLLRAPKEDQN